MIYPAATSTKFDFGKHKGKTVAKVIMEEPSYIDWCDDNIPDFDLTQEAWDLHSEESSPMDNMRSGDLDWGDAHDMY